MIYNDFRLDNALLRKIYVYLYIFYPIVILKNFIMTEQFSNLRIGTRASKLALFQANLVKNNLLNHYPNLKVEIIPIITSGDKILDKNLYEIGGKGLFTKELEEMLDNNKIDIAVHSMKDMLPILSHNHEIGAVLERENPQDVLISLKYKSILDLPQNAKVGTSSPRRAAQILNIRPDINICMFRGNVPTRINKLKEQDIDATILAMAGINRLDLFDKEIMHPISTEDLIPAIAQGAIAIENLSTNHNIKAIINCLNHRQTQICVTAERIFLSSFTTASCKTPIAAFARYSKDKNISFSYYIANSNNNLLYKDTITCSEDNINQTIINLVKSLSIK